MQELDGMINIYNSRNLSKALDDAPVYSAVASTTVEI